MSSASARGGGRLRVVVLGYIVRCPLGGMVWHHLQYVLGLQQLGHDVWFVEDSDDVSSSCYDPTRDVSDTNATYGLEFTKRTFDRVGLGDRWAYYDAHTARWLGPAGSRILAECRTADLVLNVSGANPLRPWLVDVPIRAYIDTDPGFTQIRNLSSPVRHERSVRHSVFFSFAEGIASGTSYVPDDGFPWQPTRQPVVLDAWPVTPGRPDGRFTTVMQWDSYPPREFAGRRFGMKSESFAEYVDLPSRVGPILEVAVGGATSPRDQLREHGWHVRSSLEPTRDPWTYQSYIQASTGEFSVAKHGYVTSRSGWFSERSAVYLASGRPVVAQDTGFSRVLPVGEGLLAFSSPDEATAALDDVRTRYDRHWRAARELAAEHFDARNVLGALIEACYRGGRAVESRLSLRDEDTTVGGHA
jgi:hypothetical protein